MDVDRRQLRTLDVAGSDEVTFLCSERDWGVIPEPTPVESYVDADERNVEYGLPSPLTHRKLVDSLPDSAILSDGWILSVPGEFQVGVDGAGVASVKSTFEDGDYIGTYRTGATSTEFGRCANVNTRWAVDLPEGYGLLCLPPTTVDSTRDFSVVSRFYDPNVTQLWLRVPVTVTEETYFKYGTPLAHVVPIAIDALGGTAVTRR